MKIGILSSYAYICKVNNYGSLLQYYALQTYLESLGNKVFWIRFNPTNRNIKGINQWLRKKILKSNFKIKNIEFYNRLGFEQFIRDNIHISSHEYYKYSDLKKNPPKADLYIVGSDQIWNGFSPERYLMFTPKNTPKISYAVSFGKNSIKSYLKPLMWYYLKDFIGISVRETEGINICKSVGRKDAVYSIDPTFLLDKKMYIKITNKANIKRLTEQRYIYGYFVNPFKDNIFPFTEEIREIKDSTGYEFYITAIQNAEKAFTEFTIVQPAPLEWIYNILESEAIITNSFHGVAFAINLQKNFLLFPQTGETANQNCRYFDLLKQLNLEERIYNPQKGSVIDQLNKSINWSIIDKQKETLTNKAKEYLNKYIQDSLKDS